MPTPGPYPHRRQQCARFSHLSGFAIERFTGVPRPWSLTRCRAELSGPSFAQIPLIPIESFQPAVNQEGSPGCAYLCVGERTRRPWTPFPAEHRFKLRHASGIIVSYLVPHPGVIHDPSLDSIELSDTRSHLVLMICRWDATSHSTVRLPGSALTMETGIGGM
jgi:hypothetical protein